MNTIKRLTLSAGVLAISALALPMPALAQHSGVEIWANVCGRCHTIQPPSRYTAKDWTSIVSHMTVNARLTGDQKEAILAFLKQGALKVATAPQPRASVPAVAPVTLLRPVALAQTDAKEVFSSLCAACHGKAGKGDGPAAVAFNPPPANFTKVELWKDRTDEELATSIAEGVRMMPAFGGQLKPEQIEALVKYLRALSGQSASSARKTTNN